MSQNSEQLIIANKELVFQNEEKEKRAAELVIANKELAFQNEEKGKRAAELTIANKELVFQNEEKGKRAEELIIANNELAFQNKEKEKRAAELIVVNIELAFQNEEKEKRTAELITANNAIKKSEQKILKGNRLYSFVSHINQTIVKVKDEKTLFREACRIAIDLEKFKMVWIGMFDKAFKEITLVEQSAIPEEHLRLFTHAPYQNNIPQDHVLRTGRYYVSNDIENDMELQNWKPLASERGIRSCMVLPLKKEGKVVGIFNLYAEELNFFDKEEIALLEEVAGDLSFALDMFENTEKQKNTEEQLIHNERRFRALIENSSDMKILSNDKGELIYGSPSITKVPGYSNEEFLHSLASDFIHPNDIPAYIENRKEILQAPGKPFYHQIRLRHKSGNWIWCEGTVTNWLHLAGVEALVTNFRDITEKKEFQENLEAAHAKAETERERITADLLQRNKDLEQFTYIVSHNLRAPVANIMGTSEALRTMKLEESEKEEMMYSLSASVMKLNGVIRDLNNILQTKRNVSEKREIASFSHLIKNIKISIDDQIRNEKVEIKTDFSQVDKMLTLKSYLYSVFYNLISNSIKFRQPELSPVIEIKSYQMKDKIEIHFSDNGVGIDLKSKGDQVFGLYKRFHAEVEGKGMGLFMVKTQVEALGGKIGIESEVNKGTTFILQFPV